MNFNEIFKALMSAVEDENMTVLVIILIAIVVLFGANIILGTRIGSKEEGFDFKKFLFGIEKAITMSLITMAVCYAFNLLCIGIGKAGFLTAVYIVLVPILNLLIFKKTTSRTIWIGVILALGGLYLLCINEAFTFRLSDLLVVACALLFAFQILAVDRFSPLFDALKLAAVQFFTCGVISSLLMIPMDIIPNGFQPWASSFSSPGAWISLSYAAILSSAIGYTFQIIGQKGLNPTVASLLMSLESLFAVLAGWLILHQSLTVRESIGAVLVFAAVIMAQLPTPKTTGTK